MPKWGSPNPPLFVYHGTDDVSVGAVGLAVGTPLPLGVNPTLGRVFTDFGQGFYTTTWDHQARQWANARVLRTLAPPPAAGRNAIVLRFELDRDWLAGLESLVFVRPLLDFWNLVDDCRNGFPPHQRPPRPPRNPPRAYDVVFGPVTLWPQRLLIQDCDQVSFHTHDAARRLPGPIIYDVAAGTFP
jgi:uncharacterized protein DUF3990